MDQSEIDKLLAGGGLSQETEPDKSDSDPSPTEESEPDSKASMGQDDINKLINSGGSSKVDSVSPAAGNELTQVSMDQGDINKLITSGTPSTPSEELPETKPQEVIESKSVPAVDSGGSMGQNDINKLLAGGDISELNQEEEKLIKKIEDRRKTDSEEQRPVGGEVVGEISQVTEDSEMGTNMVLGYLENVLNIAEKQKKFLKGIEDEFKKTQGNVQIGIDEIIQFNKDGLNSIESHIFDAMDAFQFEDIARQKLMKVMHTLSALNNYLNDILGVNSVDTKNLAYGHDIGNKKMDKDKDKGDVDQIVKDFQNS